MRTHHWDIYDRLHTIGVVELTLAGVVSRVNPAFAALLADDRLHVEGTNLLSSVSLEDRDRVQKDLMALASGSSEAVSYACRYMTREGGLVDCTHTLLLLRDDVQTPSHVLGWVFHREDKEGLEKHIAELQLLLTKVLEDIDRPNMPTINVSQITQGPNYGVQAAGDAEGQMSHRESHREAEKGSFWPWLIVLLVLLLGGSALFGLSVQFSTEGVEVAPTQIERSVDEP